MIERPVSSKLLLLHEHMSNVLHYSTVQYLNCRLYWPNWSQFHL